MNLITAPTGDQIFTTITPELWTKVAKKWEKETRTGTTISLVHFINHRADLGWRATLPDDDYRLSPAYSNSRLGVIKKLLMGRTWAGPRRAFVVGTAFHEMLLEPEKEPNIEDYMLTAGEERLILKMLDAASRSIEIQALRYRGVAEQAIFWKDRHTRLPCKAKIDLHIPTSNMIVDLKSTSARTQAEFEASAIKYDYLRQGVFYMDGARARSCTLVGVSKRKPYNIFFYSFRRQQAVSKAARKRYRFILQKVKQLGIEP